MNQPDLPVATLNPRGMIYHNRGLSSVGYLTPIFWILCALVASVTGLRAVQPSDPEVVGLRHALSPPSPTIQKRGSSFNETSDSPFSWDSIQPNTTLDFHPCTGGFLCARLELPMDWNSTDSNGPRVIIAIIKRPALVHPADPRYGGAVLLNPGGPGGSGTGFMYTYGPEIYTAINSEVDPQNYNPDSKYFDVISFDPRGVNASTPLVNCFPTDLERQQWYKDWYIHGFLGTYNGSLDDVWAAQSALVQGCSRSLSNDTKGGNDIAQFVNTTPVVRDMIEIMELLGQLREAEANEWLANQDVEISVPAGSAAMSPEAVRNRTKWIKGEEKLQYWGFSYGTILGSTFATMHPERVGRLILDGVANVDDWYDGGFLRSLFDADKVVDTFFTFCHEAGPEYCPLAVAGDSPSAIQDAVTAALDELPGNPYWVEATSSKGPQIITLKEVQMLFQEAIYMPVNFPVLAQGLAELVQRNGSFWGWYKDALSAFVLPPPQCGSIENETCYNTNYPNVEATIAIMCSDGADVTQRSKTDAYNVWQTLKQQSYYLGDYIAGATMNCIHWDSRPKWRFAGPMGAQTTPFLLIGNTYDPVTPIVNARNVSSKFPGSVVLEHNAPGHCTIGTHSNCTDGVVRTYFAKGELPQPGTVCPTELTYFGIAQNLSSVTII